MDRDASPASSNLLEAGLPRGTARWAGILLHGRDRTREEKVVLASSFGLEGIRWLAPAADAGSWYPGRFFEPLAANEPYLTQAIEQCDRVVDEATENGRLAPQQIFLVGFSQGACLAIEYALRRPGRCGAIVVLTGGVFGAPGERTFAPGLLDGLRVFLTGSDVDEWIPLESTERTARVLRQLGADVQLRIYPGRPHIVSPAELAEARQFITALPGPR